MDGTGALLSEPSASADPAQLTAELLRRASNKGLEIVSPLDVRDFVATGEQAALALSNDPIITCGHAVFYTGYEFLKALESREHRIISTWAIAARPLSTPPGWLAGWLAGRSYRVGGFRPLSLFPHAPERPHGDRRRR
jgi:hypothetical protein